MSSRYGEQERGKSKARRLLKQRGVTGLITAIGKSVLFRFGNLYRATLQKWLVNPLVLKWHRNKKQHQTFSFNNQELHYFYHSYNQTWRHERKVEIPVARYYLEGIDPARCLEVGNVLGHYFDLPHQVVDKYERADGIINTDIVNYSPDRTFERIISISTIEHIGFDEDPSQPEEVLPAIEHMRSLLCSDGILIATWPPGYNKYLDDLALTGKLETAGLFALHRTGKHVWLQVEPDSIRNIAYGTPWHNGNGLFIAIWQK